jgi:hypothetical protein
MFLFSWADCSKKEEVCFPLKNLKKARPIHQKAKAKKKMNFNLISESKKNLNKAFKIQLLSLIK